MKLNRRYATFKYISTKTKLVLHCFVYGTVIKKAAQATFYINIHAIN